MKIVVYAISKNECKFVDRWYNSVKEADQIYVLDTGSTDNTIELLKSHNIIVHKKKYKNFRFDTARNDSLEYVPKNTDICVCCDLDEVFESGWRKKLESSWKENITRINYTYHWNLINEVPKVTFILDKIHSRNDYKWVNPVHEVLKNINNNEIRVTNESIVLKHYPDNLKSRGSYLELLELSVLEDSNNDRNMHYLGREYMYYKRWNESIDTLIKHLNMPTSVWSDERCASMRFISRCYINLERIEEARMWLDKAMKEAPHLRDPIVEKLLLEYSLNNYEECISLGEKALKIKTHEKTYINEIFSFDNTIYDILSISYYHTGDLEKGLYYLNLAIEMEPDNIRLLENKKFFST